MASDTQTPPFGRRLRALREAAGLSLAELGERSGLNKDHLWQLEVGRRADPSWQTLTRLADALGLGIEAFRQPK